MLERRVLVTGLGAVSAAGESPEELARALEAGRPLVSEIEAFRPPEGARARACGIRGFDLSRHVPSVKSYIDRTSALALAATRLALSDAALLELDSRRGREVGLAYATQWGCLDSMELFYAKLRGGNPRFAPPLPFSHSYANSPASVASIELRLRGHHVVFSTGRTSGAWALLEAADAVAQGRAEVVACAASDSLSRAAFGHYFARGRLERDEGENEPSRFLLGEGAACLVLEAEDLARERGARPRAAISGAGSAVAESAREALSDASREALLRAGSLPGDVRAAVGTAAHRSGREAEAGALELALELAPGEGGAMLASVGAVLGETMGASALLAAVAACTGGANDQALVLCAELEEPDSPSSAAAILLSRGT